jgi:hypothetical protein
MDIMELGAIGELVGGVAVVASLLFVGVQVRTNTREQRAASMQEATRETANTVQYLTGPGYAEIWLQGMGDLQALDPADRLRFSAVLVHQTEFSNNSTTRLGRTMSSTVCGWALNNSCATSLPIRVFRPGGKNANIGSASSFGDSSKRK